MAIPQITHDGRDKKGDYWYREKDGQRTKHSRTFTTSDPNTFVTEIIAGEPQYYRDERGDWWQADYANDHQRGVRCADKAAAHFSAFPKSVCRHEYVLSRCCGSSLHGWEGESTRSQFGATVHAASTGDEALVSQTNDQCASSAWIGSGIDLYYINRGFFLFDTSAIDDGHSIDSATMSIYVDWKKTEDDDGNDFISVVATTPASTTSLSTADFDQVGSTEQHDQASEKISAVSP